MRAQDMVQTVCECEKELMVELAEIIYPKLQELSKSTGLQLSDIHIDLTEITNMSSEYKEWTVGSVTIGHELPARIWTGSHD